MENTNQKTLQQKILLSNWFNKIDEEEIQQEELIQQWKHPKLDGYQGLLALRSLMLSSFKEINISRKTTRLKKNTPDKTGVYSKELLIYDYLYSSKFKGEISFLLQSYFKLLHEGKDISSIQKLAKHLNINRSSIGRLLIKIRSQLL